MVADTTFHFDEHGSGSPVVLLHGTPSAPADFAPLIAALEPHRRVLVAHLPGYGRTPPDATPDSFAGVARRMERRLLDLGVTSADIVAFSGGAYKAVEMALRRRIAVSRMVLLAPVVGLDEEDRGAYRNIAAAVRSGAFDPRPTWLDRMASPGLRSRDADGAERILRWLDAAPLSTILDELVALSDAPDLRPKLATLTADVLVCSGSADAAVAPARAEDVARRIPHARFERIEGAGHALLVDVPERVIALIRDFVLSR
jgi:pimeloyl-ACP methyl ester carboxylesterase